MGASVRVATIAMLAVAGCDAAPTCDAAVLRERLASPGATVELGDCAVMGRFDVAPGVTLAGTGPSSAIVGTDRGPVLQLDTTGGTSIVRGLRVVGSGHIALELAGTGRAEITDVVVEVPSAGVGVTAQGLAALALRDVEVDGPATTPTIAGTVPNDPDAMRYATHGLALFAVADLSLERVDVRRFQEIAALIVDSTTTWTEGDVTECVGAGIVISGGDAALVDVRVHDLLESMMGLVVSIGLTTTRGALVRTERLEVASNPQFGVLQDGGEVDHEDPSIHDNGDVGLWAQAAEHLSIGGVGAELVGNHVAGLVLSSSEDVTVRDAVIDATTQGLTAVGTGGGVDAGDGIHIVGACTGVTLDSITLSGNARVQIVADLGATLATELTLTDVRVDGSGAQLGLVTQNGAVPMGWDTGVTRLGATVANDVAFAGTLAVFAGAVRDDERPGAPGTGDVRGIVMPID